RCLLFMGRFTLGRVSAEEVKRLLANRMRSNDFETLFSHANGPSRLWRRRSQIILFHLCGIPKRLITEFLGVYFGTVKKCILRYVKRGVPSLFVSRTRVRKFEDDRYKEMVFTILHAPPKDYGFNRTTWRLQDIYTVMTRLAMPISKGYIIRIIRGAGY